MRKGGGRRMKKGGEREGVREGREGQRRSQDFCLGGGHPLHFPSSPEADHIQWGGDST